MDAQLANNLLEHMFSFFRQDTHVLDMSIVKDQNEFKVELTLLEDESHSPTTYKTRILETLPEHLHGQIHPGDIVLNATNKDNTSPLHPQNQALHDMCGLRVTDPVTATIGPLIKYTHRTRQYDMLLCAHTAKSIRQESNNPLDTEFKITRFLFGDNQNARLKKVFEPSEIPDMAIASTKLKKPIEHSLIEVQPTEITSENIGQTVHFHRPDKTVVGTIVSVNANYMKEGLTKLIKLKIDSQPGDSGSSVILDEGHKVIGLMIYKLDDKYAFCNNIFRSLDVLCSQYTEDVSLMTGTLFLTTAPTTE